MTIPSTIEKPLISGNGTAESTAPQPSTQIDKLLKADLTLAVWLIFLAIGGGLLALYYSRIRYLPDIEWEAALVYIFVASMIGGVIGLLLTLSLYLPGVIWSDIIIFDPALDNTLNYNLKYKDSSGKELSRKEPCVRSIMLILGLPFLTALFLSHLALRAPEVELSASKVAVIRVVDLYLVFAAVLLVLTFGGMYLLFRFLKLKLDGADNGIITRQIFKYSSWFTLSVLLNQVSMYVIYRLSGRPSDRFDFAVLTALCTLAVWISAHAVATRHRYAPRQAVVASLVAAGLLLFTADKFSSLSKQLMTYYGFGGDQKFNLVISDRGAQIIKGHNFSDPNCPEKTLCGVKILSKLGDEYYLEVRDQTYFTLPKSDVLSIRPLNLTTQ